MCPSCKSIWTIHDLSRSAYACPACGRQLRMGSDISVRSATGKVLTPCTRERANKELLAGRAHFDDEGTLWLYDSPERNALYRRKVFERDHGTCLWCGHSADTVDHVVPYSEGGIYHPLNLVCACERCNQKRQNRDAFEFLELLAGEGTPSPYAGYVVERYALAYLFVRQAKELQEPHGRR
jgi:hypothetical protein